MGWADSFETAKENCETVYAKLAEPNSKCESDLLQYYLQIRGQVNSDAYIGVRYDGNGTLKYVSDEANVPFHYLNPSQRNENSSCVHLHGRNVRGMWHKKSCDSGMLFICEKSL